MEESPAVPKDVSLPTGIASSDGGRPPPSPLSGGYLLIVISEPQTDAHKSVILQKLTKVALNQLHLGIGDGWLSPTLKKLEAPDSELYFSIDDQSWLATAGQLGKILGCLIPALCMDIVGRKLILSGCALIFFLVWVSTAIIDSVSAVCLLRLLFGIAYGANNAIDTIYLAEVSSSTVRGTFGTIIISLYSFGTLLEYILATYLSYRATAIVNTCLALLTLPSVLWMLESPQFLLLRGRLPEAETNFMQLRDLSDIAEHKREFQRMRENARLELCKKESIKKVLFSPSNYKSTLIVVTVYALCDATGYMVVIGFASSIFSRTQTLTENQLTILLGGAQFAMGFFSLLLINRCERRSHLFGTFSVIAVTMMCAAILFYVHDHLTEVPYFPWLIFSVITLYICSMAVAYPAVYALRGELLPLSAKALGGCLVMFGNSVTNTVESMSFLYVADSFGMYVNFAIYSAMGLLFVLFVRFCVPETGKKSLTEIQEELVKADCVGET